MTDDTLILIEDEPPQRVEAGPSWTVMIVDDDRAVHRATRFALADYRLDGRGIELVSAHSAAEARALLQQRTGVAVMFVDVVMETDDAGLRLIRHIREDLGNRTVRVILRTGQPGSAPLRQVVQDYDINDYRAKTELTYESLFGTLTTALRSYEQLVLSESGRRAMESVVEATARLLSDPSLETFHAIVLETLDRVLGQGGHGAIASASGARDLSDYCVAAGSGRFAGGEGRPLAALLDGALSGHAAAVAAGAAPVLRDDGCALRLPGSGDGDLLAVFAGSGRRPLLEDTMVAAILGKLSIAHRNARLVEELRRINHDLEERVAARTRDLLEANARLERLATTDPLTGVANRRRFMERAEEDLSRIRRSGRPLAVLLLDIDHFKAVNDTHGHAAGDDALRHFARIVAAQLRSIDLLGRLGGEEFAVLLPDADPVAALQAAERIRAAAAAAPLDLEQGRRLVLTVSIGCALCTPADPSIDVALARADQAVYTAKRSGRNRVVMAE